MKQYYCFFLMLLQFASSCRGFVESPPLTRWRPTQSKVFSTQPFPENSSHKNADDIIELRADIERLRQEAFLRLEALHEKLILKSKQNTNLGDEDAKEHHQQRENPPIIASLTAPSTSSSTRHDRVNLEDIKTMQNLTSIAEEFERDMHLLNQKLEVKSRAAALAAPEKPHPLKLLDDTRWRISLDVHRVRGTWMPKTWGASGDKLRLKLEMEFTTDELYEREDFFNGLSDGSKVLRIVQNEASMAPTMTQGGKSIRVVNGGWRVCPMEGPLNTAILRWFFDVEEEARHLGSDIYLPAGRVYGTCGYFPIIVRSNVDGKSKREVYQQALRQIEAKYRSLQEEQDSDTDLISMEKLMRFQAMQVVRNDAAKIKKTINEELKKEPPKSSLRLSRDQKVGLSREGGLCCKKQNGLTQEYHILGKFEIASIENRERSDYRDLLRP